MNHKNKKAEKNMKSTKASILVVTLCFGAHVQAQNEGVDEKLGYPRAESGNSVSVFAKDGLPKSCYHPKIEQVIKEFESGKKHYADFKPDETVTKGWETFDKRGELVKCPVVRPEKTGDYCWAWLSDPVKITDTQLPFGVSVRMAPTDNRPHYHAQRECFYIFEGETLLNVDGKYQPVSAGMVVDSGPNSIHDFVAVKPGIYAQMYWYPDDGDYKSFLYGRRSNTTSQVARSIWDRLDAMRTEKGLAPIGTVPATEWWKINNPAP
ncbi:cupin domain-containing protein [Pseudomonas taeanensis]|jgi:mannose-6-phosphate isomerase-like protein (cupin superfamily)|uniref:cupin domain-containing protein n=1 Tax=Pseudomonas taeanensis TaxID=574962 RepID=UPI0009F94E97|nr:cupin domain-containing protein [Pseudomonas taeanensis]